MKKIIVAITSDIYRLAVVALLKKVDANILVRPVSNIIEFLDEYGLGEPSLIILDEIIGREIIEEFRKGGETVPVIITSEVLSNEDIAKLSKFAKIVPMIPDTTTAREVLSSIQ